MEIAKADLSHVEELAKLNKCLIEDEGHPNEMDILQLAGRMTKWLRGEYDCYLMIEDGAITAYCLFRDDGDYFYMRQLFVDRAHRREGIATGLLDWMFQHVWNGRRVRLDVLAHNEDAIAFYEAYGFRVGCLRMEK